MGDDCAAQNAANKELVGRFLEDVFVRRDLSRLDEYIRDDYIQHNPDCPQGKAGFRDFFGVIFRALPDFRYTVKNVVADGDTVMAWCTTTGTHTGGNFLGQSASGNQVRFDVVDIFRMEDGLIAEHWDVADTFTFFSQLGVVRGAEDRQRQG
jgi:predicted SnoaL-like aldol condensation-catalyzing enzyme